MAFLMSWTLIEKKIEAEYHLLVKEQIEDKNQEEKLKHRKFKTIDDKIEVIRLAGYLDNKDYEIYIELKKIRNRIIHQGIRTDEIEAKKCIDLSIKIVREELNL